MHFVVPAGLDDPQLVSGGNVFDRHVRDGLSRIGWEVRMCEVGVDAVSSASPSFAHLPDDALVLIDGLVARRWPEAAEDVAERLRLVVIAHMVSDSFPDADPRAMDAEGRALRAARGVIATSAWTRSEIVRRWGLPPHRVDVATPGTEDAEAATGTSTGGALLCVGVIAPHKGQDTLVEALVMLGHDAPWTCTIAGSKAADPEFAGRVARLADAGGLGDRVTMPGVLAGADLSDAYRSADLLVAPSRTESYGLAIADAVGRGIPVVASRVGGIPQTVATGAAVLVPPGDPQALSDALQEWMIDPGLRSRLRDEARRGMLRVPRWTDTADHVAVTLSGVG